MILVGTFIFLNSILGLIIFMETKCKDPNLVTYDATQIGIDAVVGVTWGVGARWGIPPIIFIPKNSFFGCRVEEGQTNKCSWSGGKEVFVY